ncbi:MAG: VanZ family protein [Balneolales bacterium]|nr:VanZ family protein [Balneolales bacterium]
MNTSIFKHPLVVKSIPIAIIVWTLIIIYLTTFPSDKIANVKLFQYDKLGHFLIFGGWTFLLGLIQLVYRHQIYRSLYPIPIAGVLFGGLIEIAQYILPYGRYASWDDVIANTLGCILAYLVLRLIQRSLIKNEPEAKPAQAL